MGFFLKGIGCGLPLQYYLFIYFLSMAVSGLSCGTQDLSLQDLLL